MVGFRRRRTIEGWSLEVSGPEAEEKSGSWLQRVGDNNKLWACSLVAIVLLSSICLMRLTQSKPRSKDAPPPGNGVIDQRYKWFEKAFKQEKSYEAIVLEDHFVGTDVFRITTPADVGTDNIGYMSRMAAEQICARFNHRVVVQVYSRGSDGTEELMATTSWDMKKGGFHTRPAGRKGVSP